MEKNWVAFSVKEEDGKDTLYFVYAFNPLKILRVVREETGTMKLCYKGARLPALDRWERRFGTIRGAFNSWP